jgi:SNF2 family DNA or RNA helicase
MLDLISRGLDPQLLSLGLSSARIDGQSSLQHRRNTLERFNSDKGCVVMLATIGAVGEGYVLSFYLIPLSHIFSHTQPLASL